MSAWLLLLSDAILVAGIFFVLTGSIGLHRMPNFYMRTHATSVIEGGGAGLVLIALILRSEEFPVLLRLVLIMLFMLFTTPTAAYVLAQSALKDGLKPIRGYRERFR